ncbi:hypothetical protein RQP53_13360 [Paucibacter sp. APW11]|uniref:Uncharacterized protein n=1 Tax=Roseateles aquae TaxID=3077235 RepID=A0ABU3PCE8_9BURK|nr:hypothetical protein [Paucibacter sp. APW11]MDT9000255.1 hypothetical protein [Paucibacter sp. APW11]
MAAQHLYPLVNLFGLGPLAQAVDAAQRFHRLWQPLLANAEPVMQFHAAPTGLPLHQIEIGLIAVDSGIDAHRHPCGQQPGAQRRLGTLAVWRVADFTPLQRGSAEHALQHEDEMRQHLAAEAALLALAQPGTGRLLPGPRPSGEAQPDVDLLQRAQRQMRGGAKGQLQRSQARRGSQRKVHRSTSLLGIDARDAGLGRRIIDAQWLLAEHAEAGVKSLLTQRDMGVGR